jgi:serine/threonine protein kinase
MAERYKIYEQLGAGGVGAVYRAYDNDLKRWVAIKRLIAASELSTDASLAADLRREADALAAMRNPNVVTIFDVASDSVGLFMVMELLEGEDLADVVARGPLHYDDFKELASQTLEALLAAHQRHILHRDIKPENIKVERLPGGRMQSKIIDFGLARSGMRARKQTEDQSGTVMGSIFYMAPEQLTRKPVDEKTDLYSLGCVFYEALSGRKAFDGETVDKVIDAHINHDIIPLNVIAPHVPAWLGAWVLRLMAQKPEDRPANAQQAIEEFRSWEKMSSAPAMMPWMPMNYAPMPMNYTQPMYPGNVPTGSVPVHPMYYQTGQVPTYQPQTGQVPTYQTGQAPVYEPTQTQPIIQAQPAAEVIPVTNPGTQTKPLSAPKAAGPRQPQGGRAIATKATPAANAGDKALNAKTKLYAMIGGGVVLLLVIVGFMFSGGKPNPAKAPGADPQAAQAESQASSTPAAGSKMAFELPGERIFPPQDMDLCMHLVAGVGMKIQSGSIANNEDLVTKWHDLAPRGNDNFMRTPNNENTFSPRQSNWSASPQSKGKIKDGRKVLHFVPRERKMRSLIISNPETKSVFPFGAKETQNPKGLTLALVFQADIATLPCRVITLGTDGSIGVTLRVDADKNLLAQFKDGSKEVSITSKNLDATLPCTVVITWDAATGKAELRGKDAPGKSFIGSTQLNAPKVPLGWLQIGKSSEANKPVAQPQDCFTGWLAEFLVYSSVLSNDQIQLLEGRVLRDYYIPWKPPAKK